MGCEGTGERRPGRSAFSPSQRQTKVASELGDRPNRLGTGTRRRQVIRISLIGRCSHRNTPRSRSVHTSSRTPRRGGYTRRRSLWGSVGGWQQLAGSQLNRGPTRRNLHELITRSAGWLIEGAVAKRRVRSSCEPTESSGGSPRFELRCCCSLRLPRERCGCRRVEVRAATESPKVLAGTPSPRC
jgi:hypothetical protein